MLRDAVAAMPWLILAMSRLTNAACECGYSVNKTSDASYQIYTELLENDFIHTQTDNMTSIGWIAQEYNQSKEAGRGYYGKEFLPENVESNAVKNASAWSGESDHGGDPGLQLWTRSDNSSGWVGSAELVSMRNDARFGSYRIAMKLSNQTGTCGAFFWYYNNSREIDMEFRSMEFNSSQGAVNYVLQTPESVAAGYDAANTSEFKVQHLDFRPDDLFHEYRWDWTTEKISYYVDGQWQYDMTEQVPQEGGSLHINHWSNGNPLWSAGPPVSDALLTVSYVKAYFNSTDTSKTDAYNQRCPGFNATAVCAIPAQTSPPDASQGTDGAKTYFFSQDGDDHTPGQTTYATTNGAMGAFASSTSLFTYLPLLLALLSWTFAL
ncbi:glycoside hydrolase family 16 protein [Lophiostoma macrostomum CBS 122681]|uniref:Glycoside hydrolase family 16 protein n=1 Tax=Lophiostoma macrostomum CBS 122681 TaxID=1314788 RepID=A0A6A6SNT4_9PLEO|nr:glycoside hydrolase family 16 protein [Lophiostoma macrostomum CBS 122681]